MNSPLKRACNTSTRVFTVQVKDKIQDEQLFEEESLKFLHRDCPVCSSEYITDLNINKISICNPCKHPFCVDCLCKWFKTNNTCPICRIPIESILIEKNIEKSFDDFCNENNIIIFDNPFGNNQYNNDQFGDELFSNLNFNFNINNDDYQYILPEFDVRSSIPINGNTTISNTTEYAVIHTNSVLSFITNSLSNEENNDDIICILDISGSMEGEKIEKSKEGIISIINSLKSLQRVSVVVFNDYSNQLFALQQITVSNKDNIISSINSIFASGGTQYNTALVSIKKIFDESNNEVLNRKRIVLFFSDGEHTDTPKLSILDDTFLAYPELLFYTISIGNNIDSSANLIPLHRNRPVEMGRYYDCPDMEKFTEIIQTIIGNSKPLFSKNICFNFEKNVKLFTTYEKVINDDETISIKIPIVNLGDVLNIAFKNNNESNVKISYTFTRVCDNVEINGLSVFDENNILPEEITIYYPISRYILDEFNIIINSNIYSKEDKKNMLIELKKNINIQNNGLYYEMLLDTINSSIEIQNNSYTPLSFLNRDISMRQSSNTQTSPAYVSRCVSDTIFNNSYLSDDENNE